eukprot:615591-Rhodomonas_salina.1
MMYINISPSTALRGRTCARRLASLRPCAAVAAPWYHTPRDSVPALLPPTPPSVPALLPIQTHSPPPSPPHPSPSLSSSLPQPPSCLVPTSGAALPGAGLELAHGGLDGLAARHGREHAVVLLDAQRRPRELGVPPPLQRPARKRLQQNLALLLREMVPMSGARKSTVREGAETGTERGEREGRGGRRGR